MRGKEGDDWAMCSQVTMEYETPHQKAWLVERHNALIRSAVQRAEAQVIKKSLCISFTTVLGLVNERECNVAVRFQGKTLDRRHQEERVHMCRI